MGLVILAESSGTFSFPGRQALLDGRSFSLSFLHLMNSKSFEYHKIDLAVNGEKFLLLVIKSRLSLLQPHEL